METTNVQTSTPARVVLAGVLAVFAVVAVAIYEFAPDVLVSIRARVGMSQSVAAAAAPSFPDEPQDEDVDPASPAKRRPVLRGAQAASQVKPGVQVTR